LGGRPLQKPISLKQKQLVDCAAMTVRGKKGGPKMKVSLTMLLKTNVEKMSLSHLETMSMKTNRL
jgi:hypothetical protein